MLLHDIPNENKQASFGTDWQEIGGIGPKVPNRVPNNVPGMFPPRTKTMGRIATVGEFLDDGTGLGIHCLGCQRYIELDLAPVAEKFGRDFLIIGADTPFRRSLRCSVCGGRNMQMTIIAPGTRMKSKSKSQPR
ncbi:MAG: hypothetical protein J0H20_07295 [Rhizobiales bacterium]|nr:hypothetical protein [Hyphomicrobiales bacterium]